MEDNKIVLSGTTTYIHKKDEISVEVLKGTIIVYIVPMNERGTLGRRIYLCELSEGEYIPSLYYSEENENCEWTFLLQSIDNAQIREVSLTDDMRQAFLTKIGMDAEAEFSVEMVNKYYETINKENQDIEQYNQEANSVKKTMFDAMYDVLLFGKNKISSPKKLSHDMLYDSLIVISSFQRMRLVPFEILKDNCGNNYTINDIARLSGFLIREVILEEDWYKKDCGPIIGYINNQPVACLPKGANGYYMWDPATSEYYIVDKTIAKEFKETAYVIYAPLPDRAIGWKELLIHGFKGVSRIDIIRILLLTLMGTLIGLIIPRLNEYLFDFFIPLGDYDGLYGVGAVVLACSLGNICFTLVKGLTVFRNINRMKYSVEAAIINRLFCLPESFFRKYDSADLMKRTMDISAIFTQVASTLISASLSLIFSMMYLMSMFMYSKVLSIAGIKMLIIYIIPVLILGIRQLRYEGDQLRIEGEMSSTLYQLIGAISKLRMAGAEERGLNEYIRQYSDAMDIEKKKEWYSRVSLIFSGSINIIMTMYMYHLMIHKNLGLSVGAFMAFNSAFGAFSAAILQLVNSWININNIIPAYKRVKPILETPPEQAEGLEMPGDITGNISIDHVTFAYDKAEEPVIRNLSLNIKQGEYIGIVGQSGCGKSTLLKLLLGFEKPQKGIIYYDGHDIEGIDKRELRKKLGVVLQDGGLINGSIYENITITCPGASIEDVKNAVKIAGLEKDIALMPMGLHTVLTDGDGGISGGQKQRVLIARAIVGNPKVLYFDEATSALDNITQAQVSESLDSLDNTRIVIAHRLSTIINCDRILVMDKGVIVESGTYKELMALKGKFYDLARRQII